MSWVSQGRPQLLPVEAADEGPVQWLFLLDELLEERVDRGGLEFHVEVEFNLRRTDGVPPFRLAA